MAAGFARITKARGIVSATLDYFVLPVEVLELLLRALFDIVNFGIFFRLPNINIVGVRGRKLKRRYVFNEELLVCLVTVFIRMLFGMSTTIIEGVRGSWEVQDRRSSI